MPAFNAGRTIKESVKSVSDQTYSNWELIIINDASTDDTLSIVNEYASTEPRIRVVNLEKNKGLSNARNEGIKIAKGDYVTFLDSDDIWADKKLTIQVTYHINNPGVKISHTNFEMFNENGPVKRRFKALAELTYKKDGIITPSIYSKNTIGILTVMIEGNLLVNTGGFDTTLWTMEDQDLWIRIAKQNEQFGYVKETLAYYRLSNSGMTNKLGKYKRAYKALIKKYKTDIEEYNILGSALANYYRYFGLAYYKKHNYKLSLLYLIKATTCEKHPLDSMLNLAITARVLPAYLKERFF